MFETPRDFANREINVAMGRYSVDSRCGTAVAVFRQESKLKGELRMPQPNHSTGMYKCSACGETFESQLELRDHEKDCQQQADRATAGPKK